MSRFVLCCVLALALSGCAASPSDDLVTGSLDNLVQPTPVSNKDSNASAGKQTARAIASLPPEAGSINRVSQMTSANGLRQEIIYVTRAPGLPESAIDLRIRIANAPMRDDTVVLMRPSEAGIKSELATQFPRMAMRIVETPRSNAYGPYGLAVGRWSNGSRCLYAWQWIDDVKTGFPGQEAHPVSLRIRLCRNGMSLDEMAGLIDRLHLDPVQPDDAIVMARADPVMPPRLKRPVLHRVNSRPANVVASPQVAAPRQDAPLDPSLPAAAYRGPVASVR